MSLIDDCKIIMPSCDKYIHLLPGNVFLVEHFWPEHPKIFVLGFKDPQVEFPNDRWEFVSLGEDLGKESWSNDLIKFFDGYGDQIGDYFIHMNDDAPPLRPVDNKMIEFMFDYMKADESIGKFCLSGNRGYTASTGSRPELYNPVQGDLEYRLGEIKPDGDYRIALANDIWKKEYFMKYLKPNLSSWGWETRFVTHDGYKVMTTDQEPPIVFCHVYRQSGFFSPSWYINEGHQGQLPDVLRDKYIELTDLKAHMSKKWKS